MKAIRYRNLRILIIVYVLLGVILANCAAHVSTPYLRVIVYIVSVLYVVASVLLSVTDVEELPYSE